MLASVNTWWWVAALLIPEIAKLLDVVPGAMPGGADLRVVAEGGSASPLIVLRRLAVEARARERKPTETVQDGTQPSFAPPTAAWTEVSALGTRILREEAKDIEAAACCCEAWLRLAGLEGLRSGLLLMQGLVEDFWEVLHPLPGPDGSTAGRTDILRHLDRQDGAFLIRLRVTPILGAGLSRPVSLWDLQQMDRIQALPADTQDAERSRAGLPSPQELRRALEGVSAAVEEALSVAAGALAAADGLAGALAKHEQGMPLRETRDALAEIRSRLDDLAAVAASGRPRPATRPQGAETLPVVASATGTADPRIQVTSLDGAFDREAALRLLSQISARFRETEPHSPVSYLIEQAVRWGRMPLPALLSELLPEGETRDTLFRLTGLPRAEV